MADRAPAAEYADCSKDSPPSYSPAECPTLPAATKIESSPSSQSAWDHSDSLRIPSDTESNSPRIPEFPDQVFHSLTKPGQDETARNQMRKTAHQCEFPAPSSAPLAPLPAGIACGFQNSLRTSLPARVRSEIRAPGSRDNV